MVKSNKNKTAKRKTSKQKKPKQRITRIRSCSAGVSIASNSRLEPRLEEEPQNQINSTEETASWFHRPFDGIGNNLNNPLWGSANTALLRMSPYEPFESRTTNPRIISNIVCSKPESSPNLRGVTDMFWGWGQFIDHLLDLTPDDDTMTAPIIAPPDDPVMPNGVISFKKSRKMPNSSLENPNTISSYIDGTNVYGTESERIYSLRRLDGTGKLKTQMYLNSIDEHELLPANATGLPNAELTRNMGQSEEMFLAGDIRANENVLLTSLHTLFVLEHNRQCDEILTANPQWSGNESRLFAEARKRVVAHMQAITYQEFIPLLLGSDAMPPYTGYNPDVNAGINQEFSACAYRLGHSMVSGNLQIGTDDEGMVMNLVDVFFNPDWLKEHGIKGVLEGAAAKEMQQINTMIVPELRSFLFGPHAPGMFLDLAALNIQRGRDHGLTDYNSMRVAYGLPRLSTFDQITIDSDIASRLSQAYNADIDIIDPWIGGLAEDHVGGGQVGPLFRAIILDTFTRLRDGDRYYYETDTTMTPHEIRDIKRTTLGDLISRNCPTADVSSNVFVRNRG